MSINYGLNIKDLQAVKNKLAKQKNYLEQNKFLASDGKEKCLLDVSYSANLSARYYPRILNKVNTFIHHAFEYDLVPVFLTVTLDGFFRDLLKGDYSRFTKEKREEYIKHIPNNERSGFYLDYMDKQNTLRPKDLYKILGHQMHRFSKSESLRRIKKDGFTYSMIRVTEPHKDGTPHFHILMHVPKQYISSVYKEFERFFPAPQNHKKLTSRKAVKISDNIYETNGFQTEIRNAASYVLKYVLKSFVNLIEEKEVDYLQAWYVHNRIPRIITTHTLVSQDVYHHIAPLDDDWHYLTNIKINEYYERDKDNNTFTFDDGNNRRFIYDNGLMIISHRGKVVASYGSKTFTLRKVRLRSLTYTDKKPNDYNMLERFIFYIPPTPYSYYITKVFKDGTMFCIGSPDDLFISFNSEFLDYDFIPLKSDYQIYNNSLNPSYINDYSIPDHMIPIARLSDVRLYSHYLEFDSDICNPARYALLNNELIERGLISSGYLNLNEFNESFYDG